MSVALDAVTVVIPLYLLLYVVQNLWKPWSVAAVSDLMGDQRRALVLLTRTRTLTITLILTLPNPNPNPTTTQPQP